MSNLDDYNAARRAVMGAYARRYGAPATTAKTDFPADDFVKQFPIAKTPDLQEHRVCWAKVRKEFEVAWRRHLEDG